jgi:hypothetical protein
MQVIFFLLSLSASSCFYCIPLSTKQQICHHIIPSCSAHTKPVPSNNVFGWLSSNSTPKALNQLTTSTISAPIFFEKLLYSKTKSCDLAFHVVFPVSSSLCHRSVVVVTVAPKPVRFGLQFQCCASNYI